MNLCKNCYVKLWDDGGSMPNTNITKIAIFVIFAAFGAGLSSACVSFPPDGAVQAQETADFGPPEQIGKLRSPDLKEASGITASQCQPNVYWTHNDSGDGPFIYAINTNGTYLGVWRVAGAGNIDWEDIAAIKDAGKCYLLIGDIGNNDLKKKELTIYRVAEPTVGPRSAEVPKNAAPETAPSQRLTFEYPDKPHNAETLLVHPVSGEIYVLTKSKKEPVSVYKLKADFSGADQLAVKIAEFSVPAVPSGYLTGGDISPDGKRIVLCDYVYGYEMTWPALAVDFDDIWRQPARRFDLGDRAVGEAVSYTAAGDAVIAVSEEVNTPVFRVARK